MIKHTIKYIIHSHVSVLKNEANLSGSLSYIFSYFMNNNETFSRLILWKLKEYHVFSIFGIYIIKSMYIYYVYIVCINIYSLYSIYRIYYIVCVL